MRRRAWLSLATVLAAASVLWVGGCTAPGPTEAPPSTAAAPLPLPQPREPRPAPSADVTITPESVAGDGRALQAALDRLTPGQTAVLTAGEYQQDGVLTVRVPDVTIAGPGAVLVATDEQRSAFHVAADGVVVQGITFGVRSTSQRWTEYDQMRVRVSGYSGVTLRDITVSGSAASGIFIGDGAADFTVDHVVVRDTRADGIHITGGSHDGTVDSPLVERTGDDGVAVVSYGSDSEVCRDITVLSPTVNGTTWGRGISVVGGERITYQDVDVRDTNAAGIYLAVEGDPYDTRSTSDVLVRGGTVTGANYNADIDHGAVLVYNGRDSEDLTSVAVEGVAVRDTRRSASASVAIRDEGGAVSGVALRNLVVEDGPADPLLARAAARDYTVENWRVNGQDYQP
jgi:hypothetical protein